VKNIAAVMLSPSRRRDTAAKPINRNATVARA
jgi:hypothetical protein